MVAIHPAAVKADYELYAASSEICMMIEGDATAHGHWRVQASQRGNIAHSVRIIQPDASDSQTNNEDAQYGDGDFAALGAVMHVEECIEAADGEVEQCSHAVHLQAGAEAQQTDAGRHYPILAPAVPLFKELIYRRLTGCDRSPSDALYSSSTLARSTCATRMNSLGKHCSQRDDK